MDNDVESLTSVVYDYFGSLLPVLALHIITKEH
jgi:hypothetical protein